MINESDPRHKFCRYESDRCDNVFSRIVNGFRRQRRETSLTVLFPEVLELLSDVLPSLIEGGHILRVARFDVRFEIFKAEWNLYPCKFTNYFEIEEKAYGGKGGKTYYRHQVIRLQFWTAIAP